MTAIYKNELRIYEEEEEGMMLTSHHPINEPRKRYIK
jgi:hypothetical protein